MKAIVECIFVMLVFPSLVIAGSAEQTDWSGGDGTWGPVFYWGNTFCSATGIECYSSSLHLPKQTEKHTVDWNFNGATSVYSADINGDGYMDILGAAGTSNVIAWWENVNGSGTSWTKHTVDDWFCGASSVYSADVNGDGNMDVLGACLYDNDITWWENNNGSGTSWTEHTVDGNFGNATSVYSADINGDGDMDILGASKMDDDITWWENVSGSGTSWTEHTVNGNFDLAQSVYSADVNGDGYMDILGAAGGSDVIAWWENVNGLGTSWTGHTVDGYFSGANSVYSADVNGDGYMDVLGAAMGANDITWWKNNNGLGTSWTKYTIDGNFSSASSVYSADLNGNGYMDVLGAGVFADGITWWENADGSGSIWIEHIVDNDFDGARGVYSADVDGDGNMDVLGAAGLNTDDITWWELLPLYISNGVLESSVLDVQESPSWNFIDWTSNEPYGTSVAFQVRASDNSSSMGVWSDTLTSPCNLLGILAEGDNYFQYRAILTATNPLYSPSLDDVSITWNPVDIEDESSGTADVYALYGSQPNPSFGSTTLLFSLPVNSWMELTVYDLNGRVIHYISGDYESGIHEVLLNDLACGVYLARMTSEEFTSTKQFVVINSSR